MKKQLGLPAIGSCRRQVQAGQTLIEILLAFSVSILVLTSIAVGVTTSLSNSQYTRNQNLANSYAQEGMAVVRKIRDSSWYDFSAGLKDYSSNTKYCINKSQDLVEISSASNCTGNDAVGAGGIFSREVKFEHDSSDCSAGIPPSPTPAPTSAPKGTKVMVTTSWTDNKCPVGSPYCHKTELISCFSNLDEKSLQSFAPPPILTSTPTPTPTPMFTPTPTPITATFYSSVSDAMIYYDTGATYNIPWAAASAQYVGTNSPAQIGQLVYGGPNYAVRRAVFYFDTSSLPDTAIISAATFSIYGESDLSTTDFDVTLQNGQPAYPSDPPVVGDFNKSFYSGNGGSVNTVGWNTAGYNNIILNASGISWINKIGTTKLMLRSSRDIFGTAPTGDERVGFYLAETGLGYRPKLVVTYTP